MQPKQAAADLYSYATGPASNKERSMNNLIVASTLAVWLGTSAQAAGRARDDGNSTVLVQHEVGWKGYEARMKEFVEFAANADVSALMGLMSRAAIEAEGPERIKARLVNEFIPFFAQRRSLHKVTAVNRAVGPTGFLGYWFDTYIVTASGDVRPFTIVVIHEGGDLVVHEVIVNRCRMNRHPFCP